MEFDTADRMRRALRVSDISVQEIAEYLGVTRGTVSTWINGRIAPGTQTLRLFAMRTGFPFDWLAYGVCTPSDLNREPTDYAFGEAPIAAFIVGPWGPSIVLEEAA